MRLDIVMVVISRNYIRTYWFVAVWWCPQYHVSSEVFINNIGTVLCGYVENIKIQYNIIFCFLFDVRTLNISKYSAENVYFLFQFVNWMRAKILITHIFVMENKREYWRTQVWFCIDISITESEHHYVASTFEVFLESQQWTKIHRQFAGHCHLASIFWFLI